MQPDATKIQHLLKQTQHFDKDERFMATSDLTDELMKVEGHLDAALQTPIRDAILKQLDDASNDVQAIACRCLSAIVQKFAVEQVEEIVNKLGHNVVEGKLALRDVYTIALKNCINGVPDEFGASLANKLVPIILTGFSMKVKKGETLEDQTENDRDALDKIFACLDILKELLDRFGYVISEHHRNILAACVPMLHHPKVDVRKKVGITLGAVVPVLDNDQFSELMRNLIRSIQDLKQEDPTLFTYIQTIGIFSRNAGKRISDFLNSIVPMLLNFSQNADDTKSKPETIELFENCCQAFETLIGQCPSEIKKYTDELLELGLRLMCYDPNWDADWEMNNKKDGGDDMDDDGDDDDWGDDGDWGADDVGMQAGGLDDDVSWKVRRAAVKMLAAYIQTHKQSVLQYHLKLCDQLLERFKERDVNVKLEVFQAFRELLMASIVAEGNVKNTQATDFKPFEIPALARQVSEFTLMSEKLPRIMDVVASGFEATGTVTQRVQIQSGLLNILRDLVLVRSARRSERCVPLDEDGLRPYFDILIPQIMKCCTDEDIQLKAKALYVLYLIASRHRPEEFRPILGEIKDVVLKSVDDEHSRVKCQALLTAARIVEVVRPLGEDGDTSYDTSYEPLAREIFELALKQMGLKDVEQEVKVAALNCVATCIAHFGDIFSADLNKTLTELVDRLKNEVTRQTALHAFTLIANSPLNVNLQSCVDEVIQTSAAFLRQKLASLRHDTAIALAALVKNSGANINAALIKETVTNSAEFIGEQDLHLCALIFDFESAVILSRQDALGTVAQVVFPNAVKFMQSPLIQGKSLQSLKNMFVNFHKVDGGKVLSFNALKSQFIGAAAPDLHRAAYTAISECLAAITLQCDEATSRAAVHEYIGLISSKNDNESQVALLCIGEIGRVRDLSVHEGLEKQVFNAFAHDTENVKWAASYALGTMAVGNLNLYVPALLKLIEDHRDREYLLLNSLKQIIVIQSATTEGSGQLKPYAEQVVPLLLRSANSQDEGVRAMVAECLGRFAVIQETIFNEINSRLADEQKTTRSTMAAALKYGLSEQNKFKLPPATLEQFFNTLRDNEVMVKRQAFLTFNGILHANSSLVAPKLDDLLPIIYEATKLDESLIKEVDLGPFKHRVDGGLPLRKAAFQCLDSLLDIVGDQLDIEAFVAFLQNGIVDESLDIQMLTYQILTRLAKNHGSRMLSSLNNLPDNLMKGIKGRMNDMKGQKDAERAKDILRASCKALFSMKSIPDSSSQRKFTQFYSRVQKTKVLVPMLAELKAESERR